MTTALAEPDSPEAEAWRILSLQASQQRLTKYIRQVVIDGARGPRPFGEVWEPWQKDAVLPILRAIEGTAGINPDYKGPLYFWRDLPQGHDKTSGIARILNGALAFARRPLRMGVFAVDSYQAGRIWQFMQDEAKLNPWFADRLQFVQSPTKRVRGIPTHFDGVTCGGGEVEIHDSGYESNAGHKLDVTIFEELTWWPEKGKRLFDQLYTRRHKREGSVLVVLGNAGIKRTWQHEQYLEAISDSEWDVFRTEGSVASWIPPEKLAKDRRTVAPSIAARVYDNRWIEEDENAYLMRWELDAAAARASELGVTPLDRGISGVKFVAAIDYGATKDWCAMCVLGVFPDGTHRVVKLDVMMGDRQNPVPLSMVNTWAELVNLSFRPMWVVDVHQMEWFVQAHAIWQIERFNYRGGLTNFAMADHVRTMIVNRMLLWPEQMGCVTVNERPYTLADEFCDLVTVDMGASAAYRWDHKANKHDDRATAVGMASYYAAQIDLSGPFSDKKEHPKLDMSRKTDLRQFDAPVDRFRINGVG